MNRFYLLLICLFGTLGIYSFTMIGRCDNPTNEDQPNFDYMISGCFGDSTEITEKYAFAKKYNWQELTFFSNYKFYLTPITLGIGSWYDECAQTEFTYIGSKPLENSDSASVSRGGYIYLTGLNASFKEIPSHFHTQLAINPGTPYIFEFGGRKYTLRAEGKLSGSDPLLSTSEYEKDELGRAVNLVYGYNDYKLYLESEGIVQLLNSDAYNHTCLKILFIGDLDGDGKADFLFETNTWYEGEEVSLFLSSKADIGELVKNMGASANSYAC